MSFEEIVDLVKVKFGGGFVLSLDELATPKAMVIDASRIVELMVFLHEHDQLYFDSLSCITGLDNGAEANTMEVAYNLYSIPYNHHLMVKVSIQRSEQPEVDSLTGIWKTADWHEREIYDLLGINFTGHPDMRRILMPADWEGHPLRKDYAEQEFYRGIKVEY